MKKLEISSVCNRCLSIVSFEKENVTNGYFAFCAEHDEDLERWETFTQFSISNELADTLRGVLANVLDGQGSFETATLSEIEKIYNLLQSKEKGE